MKKILLFHFILYSALAIAQTIPQNPNKTENGLRQGKWTILFNSDWVPTTHKDSIAFYRIIEYKDDKPLGLVTDYYLSGIKQFEGYMVKDRPSEILDGKVVHYREDGSKETESTYQNGKLIETAGFNPDGTEDVFAKGQLYHEQGLYAKAEPLLIRAIKEKESQVGRLNSAYAERCLELAYLLTATGNNQKAEFWYLEAIDVFDKVEGKKSNDYARAIGSLGVVYSRQGLIAKAEPLLVETVHLMEIVNSKLSIQYVTATTNLAAFYSDYGLFTKAEELLLRAKEIAAQLGEEGIEVYANACSVLGVLYFRQGKWEKGTALHLEAKEIREKLFGKLSRQYATSCMNLGSSYLNQKLFSKAEPLLLEAKEIWLKISKNNTFYTSCCNQIAALYLAQGRYKESEFFYLEAFTIAEKTLGVNHQQFALYSNNVGYVYQKEGQNLKAEPFYLKAHQTYFSIIENQFASLSEKEKEAYLNTFKFYFEIFNSFVLSRKEQNPAIVANMYNNLLVTKALLFNAQNKVRNNILSSGNPALIESFETWRAKRNYLAKVYQMPLEEKVKRNINVEQLENEANTLEKQLSAQSELFAKANEKKRYSWQDVQKTLKSKEAAVEIVRFRLHSNDKKFTDTIYYAALIVTPKTKLPELVVFKNGNALEKAIGYYRNNIKFKLEDKESYNLFWKPIAAKLKELKINKVYVSSDGVYNSLNLQTLLNPETGKYIADEWDVQLVTNTKDLITGTQKQNTEKEALLFGYPDYAYGSNLDSTKNADYDKIKTDSLKRDFAGGRISMLPGTEKEINELHENLIRENWKSASFMMGNATEKKIKALQNPKVLHIATHGFFMKNVEGDKEIDFAGFDNKKVSENPLLRSGLLLAGSQQTFDGRMTADEEDGILTAYEAMNLNLDNTDLVVLSACETGLGEIKNGEGVFGLQRAFQTAGAKSIIMSLWKVDDVATQELMQLFYAKWLKEGNKHIAFKHAQGEMKAKYKHPFYWGAFVMVGE